MAALIRSITRKFVTSNRQLIYPQTKTHNLQCSTPLLQHSSRTYVSEIRKTAFEDSVVRLLRNEIEYEFDHSPPTQPVSEFSAFTIDDRPGEQWTKLIRKFGENEDIKVEATMFDRAAPVSGSNGGIGEEMQLHISFVVNISKGKDGDVFEILCSAWPDTIEINRLFIRQCEKMPAQTYMGPEFKDLGSELQDSLYEYLEERRIDDDLAVFLHQFMKNKNKIEYIRWMETVKTFVERK